MTRSVVKQISLLVKVEIASILQSVSEVSGKLTPRAL